MNRTRWTDRKFLLCIIAFIAYTVFIFINPSSTNFGIYTGATVSLFGWFAKVSTDEKKFFK